MKTVVLLYDTSCIYEIVILNYFLKVTGKEMQFVSLDGKEITTTEGYRIVPEDRLDSADPKDVELLFRHFDCKIHIPVCSRSGNPVGSHHIFFTGERRFDPL